MVNNGYNFALCTNIYGHGLKNFPALDNEFIGFVEAMEYMAETQKYAGKGNKNHHLWLPCWFSVSAETGKINCQNSLAQPTHLFGLDFDDEGNSIDRVKQVLDGLGCDYYMHTSMSYNPGQAEKCRAVIHTKDLIHDNAENKLLFDALQNQIFNPAGLVLDKACSNIARKFYTPASNTLTNVKCYRWFELQRGPLDTASMLNIEREKQELARIMREIEQGEKLRAFIGKVIEFRDEKPFYHGVNSHNIANPEKVQWFISLPSRGSQMATMAAHIVGYCATRFGPHVVPSDLMEQALSDWAGKTTHNSFAKNIADARAYIRG